MPIGQRIYIAVRRPAREAATMAALARGELGADPQRTALLLAKGCEFIAGEEG